MESLIAPVVEAFGPVGGLVIIGLLFWGWQERKGRIDSQESRIRETRDQAEKFYKAITALSAIEEAYKRGVR